MGRRSATHPSDSDHGDGRYDPTRDPNSKYYIDRGNVSDTSDQVHQNAEQTADQQEDGDNWLMQIINRFTRDGRVDTAYNQELSQQAQDLANGVNTRQPPTIAPANYMANPHPELQRMVTENVSPATVGEMGDTWIEAGNAMTRFQSGVGSAINSSEADWQGQAGNSARTFMANVGNWVGNAGQSAQLAGTQTNIQSAALAEAKRAMPEPVEFDIAAANRDLQSTTNPIDAARKYTTYMAQYNAQQSAHQQAARVVTTFDSSLAGASTMPAFAKPPQMNGGDGSLTKVSSKRLNSAKVDAGLNPNGSDGTGGTGGGTGGTGGGTGGGGGIPGGGGGGTGGGGGGTGSGGGPGGTGGGDIPGGAGGGGGGTGSGGGGGIPLPGGGSTGTGGGTDPSGGGGFPGGIPGGTGGNGPGGVGPGGVPIPGGSGPGGSSGGFPGGAPLPIGAGGLPGGGDFDRGAGRLPGGGRFGPGGFGTPGSSGGGAGGGFGSGAGGAGSSGAGGVRGGLGPGGGLGAGGSGLASEGAALRGGAGAAGRGGVGGMGGMAGGRGQGEDDDEHQRPSFLVEGDPDAVFGTDEATAPPVIGE